MTFILREIRNKSWWDKSHDQFKWLPKDELIGDVFKALGTTDGDLSTFIVDANLKNVDRIVAAFACLREKLAKVDYVLIPMDQVESLSAVKATPAETADDEVNRLHVDIIELTPSKLIDLAYLIEGCTRTRVLPKAVKKIVELGINSGNIDFNRINSKLKEKVSK